MELMDQNMEKELDTKKILLTLLVINNLFLLVNNVFFECNTFLTGKSYKQKFWDFIRDEKRRSNFMTKATNQPFCMALIINIGCFNGESLPKIWHKEK